MGRSDGTPMRGKGIGHAHLRRVDDGGELVNAVHAKIADGEGAAGEFGRR